MDEEILKIQDKAKLLTIATNNMLLNSRHTLIIILTEHK
jgi:hypothetical protein